MGTIENIACGVMSRRTVADKSGRSGGMPRRCVFLAGLCAAYVLAAAPLLAGGNATSFNSKPLDPWTKSSISDMYFIVPTQASTNPALPYLVLTGTCRSTHGCEACLMFGGASRANFSPFDWSIYYDTGGAGNSYAKQVDLPNDNPQYLTHRPDQFGVIRQMLHVRNGTYYLGPTNGVYMFKNTIDLFNFQRGDWDEFYTRNFSATNEAQAASWRGLSDSLAWTPMVETFGNYANLLTGVLGCDLARIFYDGQCLWQTPDNTSANISPWGQSHPLDNAEWLTLSYAPNTHFAVCITTSTNQVTVASPMGSLCVTVNTHAAGFMLSTASGIIDPYWVSTPDGQWWDKTVVGLPPGYYTMIFTPVAGVTTPASQIFQITDKSVTVVQGVYGANIAAPPVAVVTCPQDQQTVWGAALCTTTLVAAGTAPYTVTVYTNAAGGPYAPAGVATAEPYAVPLGTLPIGTYGIYATVTDSGTPDPATVSSATNTFFVSPTVTWTNAATSGNWSNPLSWDGGAVPVSGATVIFGAGGATGVVDTVSRDVSALVFNRAADFVLSASGSAGLTNSHGISVNNSHTYTLSVPLTLSAFNTWSVVDSGTLQVSGAIGGSVPLAKTGAGTLALSGNNNFTGGVTLKAGTLLLGSGNALGTGALTVNSGYINGVSGSLTMPSNNPFVLNGTFTWTGGGGYNWNMGTGAVTLNTNLTIYVGNTLTVGGPICGPGGLNALDITFKNMVGAGYGIQLQAPITLRGNQTITGSGATIQGVIGDSGHGYGVTVSVTDAWAGSGWAGYVALSGTNTYTGPTFVNSGVLRLTQPRALSADTSVYVASGASLNLPFTGTNQVCSLSTNGVRLAYGVYGSGTVPQITGSGFLRTSPSTSPGNASLVDLVPGTGTLSPAFDSGTTNYADAVSYFVGSMTVTPTAANTNATIKVNGLPVVSGAPSGAISVGIGDTNVITTVVVSPNGVTTNTYVLTVRRSGIVPTTTVLVSSANPSTNGQAVVFTATVQTNGVAAPGATGTCVFAVDGVAMATRTVTGGSAVYTNSMLALGTHTLSATYSGAANYGVSSNTLTQVSIVAPTTSTRSDGYTVVTFKDVGSGIWAVPAGVKYVQVLVVGGGGGCWYDDYQSGSGAGGMYYSASYAVTPGPIGITVGAGATDGTGSSSLFGTQLIAYGGTKGNGYTDGGDQGGYSLNGGTTVVPGNPGMHYSPMDGNWCSGGGAGHVGYKGDLQLGGTGAVCRITGSAVHYAGGGGAPSSYASSGGTGYNVGGGGSGPVTSGSRSFSGLANTGGGGGGGWGGKGGAGGSGIVIVAYKIRGGTLMLLR
ncbi:MAG: cadherin-like beta sandwich domain-containing protein [bacterium]